MLSGTVALTAKPFGTLTSDYLERQLSRPRLGENGGDDVPVEAVIIIGSDVYDKLAIIRTIRRIHARAVIFTTDLDAELFSDKVISYTRNVHVASLPLDGGSLEESSAQDHGYSLLFRDPYQAAVYDGICAIADEGFGDTSTNSEVFDRGQEPVLFEIGNRRWMEVPGRGRRAAEEEQPGENEEVPGRGRRADEEEKPDEIDESRELKFIGLALVVAVVLWLIACLAQLWMSRWDLNRIMASPVIVLTYVAALCSGAAVWALFTYHEGSLGGETWFRRGDLGRMSEGVSVWPGTLLAFGAFWLSLFYIHRMGLIWRRLSRAHVVEERLHFRRWGTSREAGPAEAYFLRGDARRDDRKVVSRSWRGLPGFAIAVLAGGGAVALTMYLAQNREALAGSIGALAAGCGIIGVLMVLSWLILLAWIWRANGDRDTAEKLKFARLGMVSLPAGFGLALTAAVLSAAVKFWLSSETAWNGQAPFGVNMLAGASAVLAVCAAGGFMLLAMCGGQKVYPFPSLCLRWSWLGPVAGAALLFLSAWAVFSHTEGKIEMLMPGGLGGACAALGLTIVVLPWVIVPILKEARPEGPEEGEREEDVAHLEARAQSAVDRKSVSNLWCSGAIAAGFVILSWGVFELFGLEPPNTPARGAFAKWANIIALWFGVIGLVFLLSHCSVLGWRVRGLTRGKFFDELMEGGDRPLPRSRLTLLMGVARRTAEIGDTVSGFLYSPAIVIMLLVVSRAAVFDAFAFSSTLFWLLLAASLGVWVFYGFVSHAMRAAVSEIGSAISRAERRLRDGLSETDPDPAPEDSLKAFGEEVASLYRGGPGSILASPAFKAALIPAASALGINWLNSL